MPHFPASAASLYYEQTGSGPDIVWVGGGGTRGQDWHRFQTPHFDTSFRSTVYDNRGIGQTTTTTDMPWRIEDFAADLEHRVAADHDAVELRIFGGDGRRDVGGLTPCEHEHVLVGRERASLVGLDRRDDRLFVDGGGARLGFDARLP